MQFTKDDLPALAKALVAYAAAQEGQGARILALSGDLGAGKTTLVQHIAHELGVNSTLPSPTFVVMRSYAATHPTFRELVHIDAYRLEDKTELRPLHLPRVFDREGALVCIEWPQKLFGTLPQDALCIELSVMGEGERELRTDPALESYLQTKL